MAVINVRTSLLQTVDDIVQYFKYDITVDFNQPYRLGRLESLARSVPGVEAVEGWGAAGAFRIRPDGSEGEDIYLQAPPAGSTMVNPTLVQGRWLLPGDENALVVSASLLTAEPDLHVGGRIDLGHRRRRDYLEHRRRGPHGAARCDRLHQLRLPGFLDWRHGTGQHA